jgi:hypothetical protein
VADGKCSTQSVQILGAPADTVEEQEEMLGRGAVEGRLLDDQVVHGTGMRW